MNKAIIDDLLRQNNPLSQGTRSQGGHRDRRTRDPKAGSTTETAPSQSSLPVSSVGSRNCWPARGLQGREETRAAEYLAGHWRKIVQQDRRRSRFSSGPALTTWLQRHRDPTRNTPKM